MDSLPLETLQRIFELACTDGGVTGNALSATSRNIRAAARRSRFHTLRIAADSDRFEDFVAFYKRECDKGDDDRPPVRHLFLQLTTRSPYETPRVQAALQAQRTGASADSRKRSPFASIVRISTRLAKQLTSRISGERKSRRVFQGSLGMGGPQPEPEPPCSSFCPRAVQELLRLTALDLWSLVVYEGSEHISRNVLPPILRGPFPLLREAAFIGLPGPFHLFMGDYETLSPVFPAVTHLHLVLDYGDVDCDVWSTLAPHVTHLRVSHIWSGHTVEQLAEAVGVVVTVPWSYLSVPNIPPRSPPPPRDPRYPSVRHLLMEPSYLPKISCHVCDSASRAHAAVVNGLGDIALQCREKLDDRRVTAIALPEPASDREIYRGDVLVREWFERVEGGEGWWKERGSDEFVDLDIVDDDVARSLDGP